MKNYALFIIAAILFSGCILRQAAFRQAPFLLRVQIDSTFDLNKSQDAFVRKALGEFLQELNKSEIPVLQNLMTIALRSLRNDVSKSEVENIFDRWNDVYTRTIARASDSVGRFLSTLRPEQRERLKKEQDKKHRQKLKALSESSEKYNETRRREIDSLISKWIGTLNEQHSKAVFDFSRQEFEWSKRELSARRRSQEHFLNTLSETNDSQKLATLFLQQQTPPYPQLDPEHALLRQERRKQWIELITSLARSMNTEQKISLERESRSLAFDLSLIGASSDGQ